MEKLTASSCSLVLITINPQLTAAQHKKLKKLIRKKYGKDSGIIVLSGRDASVDVQVIEKTSV